MGKVARNSMNSGLTKRRFEAAVQQQGMAGGAGGADHRAAAHNQLRLQLHPPPAALLLHQQWTPDITLQSFENLFIYELLLLLY